MGTWSVRAAFTGLVLSMVTIAACGGGNKPVPTAPTAPKASATVPPDPKAAEVHERITAHLCPAKNKLAELLGHKEGATPPAPAPEQSADSAPPPPTSADSKIAANQAYRVVAPSTVLIRTDRGMGTGVVIDPKGYILTNYHVIADGRKKDFIISVNVTFGDLSSTGRMTRQEKTYEAEVVKGDMIRDMAIIKVKGELPAKIQAVKLAKSAPQVAEKVIAIGHAGIGFLWAAKSCSIASVGERQQDTSRLAAYNCDNPDPALSPSEAKSFKDRCTESKKAMTEALNSATQGLAIQSDCAITHGDSGGPLVNGAGELVGLNQSISADLATASFHVHLDEIREFVGKYPEQGVAILPDPFCDGGSNTTFEDIDLDGVPETIVSKGSSGFLGYDRMSLIIDLDQNRILKKNDKGKSAKDAAETFDGEIALLTIRDTTYVWYDTDDDSKFDLLLVDKNNDGVPEQAYRIDTDGHPKEDKEALPKHDLSAKYVKDAKLHARLGKIATAIGGTKFVSSKVLTAAKSETRLPDPVLGGGTQGRALDTDGDGKPDVAVMRGTFSRGILIDADEDTLGSLKSGDSVDELVKNKKVDPEVSIIVQANAVWAMYDTDNDGKMDLALMTINGTDPSSLYATSAWKLSPGGEMTPAPEHIGRKVLRPGLMTSFPRIAKAFALISSDVAADEGLGSLPDPLLAGRARFRARDLKGIPSATMIEATTFNASAILIDVDHDTKIPKDPKAAKAPPKKPDPKDKDKDKDIPKDAVSDEDVQKILADKKYDAEVAVVHKSGAEGGSDWIYYDTDNDGKFDFVLYVSASGREPTQAWRIKPMQEKLELDTAAVAGKPYRHKTIFKDKAMGPKFKKIATTAFRASSVED